MYRSNLPVFGVISKGEGFSIVGGGAILRRLVNNPESFENSHI